MFITDQKAETISPLTLEPAQCPLTFCISQNPQHYSMTNKRAVEQIRVIEELVVEDPGMKQHNFDPQKSSRVHKDTLKINVLALYKEYQRVSFF